MKQSKILGSLGALAAISGMARATEAGRELHKAAEGVSAQTRMTAEAFQHLAASMMLKPDFRAQRSAKYKGFKMERGVAALHRDIKRQEKYLKRRNKLGRNTPAVFGFPVPAN